MLSSIKIKNYRNIAALEAQISPQSNLIIAPNGSGKTNVIEAVYYSIFGSSFRPLKSNEEVIGPSTSFAKTTLNWDGDIIDLTVSNTDGLINRNFQLNFKKTSVSKLSQKFPIILFAPHSVDIVTGEPALRRLDLDNFLTTISKDYGSYISKYKTIIKNRNAVIKQIREGKTGKKTLDYWTNEIVSLSYQILLIRESFFGEINKYTDESIKQLHIKRDSQLNISAEYIKSLAVATDTYINELQSKFTLNYEKEVIVGKTLYGVHKDDYTLKANNKDLRYIGSRGQQRIGALTIKLAQLLYYFDKFKKYPLLLLDDLMSELDHENREIIANYLVSMGIQFIITSADKNEIPSLLLESSNIIELNPSRYL